MVGCALWIGWFVFGEGALEGGFSLGAGGGGDKRERPSQSDSEQGMSGMCTQGSLSSPVTSAEEPFLPTRPGRLGVGEAAP